MGCKFPEMHPIQIQNAPRGADSSISESIPKKSECPYGHSDFLLLRWDSKARPERSEGIKQSSGLFYRAWESPLNLRRIKTGCGSNSNMSDAEKVLVQRTFLKSPIRTLAPKKRLPFGAASFLVCGVGLE